MKVRAGLALAFLLVAAFVVPSLAVTAHASGEHGLLGAYYMGSFFGTATSPWPGCDSFSAPVSPSTTPTTATVDPNINTGAPTGFEWVETGFTENGVYFHDTGFSTEWTGYITVPTTGTYTFILTSDDGSWLYIDGSQIIDNGGAHAPLGVSGTVDLTAGQHTIEVDYYETCDTQSGIDMSWTPPGAPGPQIVPTDVLTPAAIGSNQGVGVPQFPLGMAVLVAAVLPAMLLLRSRYARLP